MTLSLCMIVRDEIDFLDACLDSAAPFADEVVIVDTGSRDGTFERAASRADRVLRIEWRDHFAEARNASLEAARGDWILILDADECIRGEVAALRSGLDASRALAWRLRVTSETGDDDAGRRSGGCAREEFDAVRLFRRRPELRFSGRVHEQVTPALATILETEPGWQVATLPGIRIEHAGYRPALVAARGKRERNVRLLRRSLLDAPADPYLHYKLFQALGPGDPEAGRHLDVAAEHLLASPAAELRRQATAAEALTAAAQGWLARGLPEPARRACRRVLDVLGSHPATRLVHGQALLAAGRAAEALPEIERALGEALPEGGFGFDRDAFAAAGRQLLALAREQGSAR